ncbi:MAG: hypothetical protein JXB26_20075 [Candidatus Aminicenantes bacterium]|nr:hypothetical protein [Candidatus Aminicenantes bacterium]
MSRRSSCFFDLAFAFFHLFLLIGILGFAVFSLLQGNTTRFLTIIVLLVIYYFLVLHKAVKQEITRKRKERRNS